MGDVDTAALRSAHRRLFVYGIMNKIGSLFDYEWKSIRKDQERCRKLILSSVVIKKDPPTMAAKSRGFAMNDLYDLFKRRKDRDSK